MTPRIGTALDQQVGESARSKIVSCERLAAGSVLGMHPQYNDPGASMSAETNRLIGAAVYLELAKGFEARGDIENAEHHLKCSIQAAPEDPIGYFSLGVLLASNNRVPDAIPYLNHGCQLEPTFRNEIIELLHQILSDKQRESEQLIGQSEPDFGALLFLGKARYLEGKAIQSVELLNRALTVEPGNPAAEYSLAFAQLLLGDFKNGWHHYESRFRTGERQFPRRCFTEPTWDGSEIGDRRLLVYSEQGLGDTIQFARYIPLLRQRCTRVLLECQPQLKALLAANMPCPVFAGDERGPAFDLQVPLMSLPRIFRTTLESIPRTTPYLRASHSLPELPAKDCNLCHLGIVWAGNPALETDLERSIPLEMFRPVLSIPGTRVYSLQKGPARRQLLQAPGSDTIIDLSPMLHNFADTAAAIAQLDLVISVDTAVAHLAGALACPVWVLLPFAPEWRWLLNRTDSPWYPTMRLFRQSQPHDWLKVMERVSGELRKLLSTEHSFGVQRIAVNRQRACRTE